MAVEDERVALSKRFRDEGLDCHLSDIQKLPHVWRWLVDAETNCMSLRHQIDKLHRQHDQDLKEVEEYLEHVWKLSNERLLQLEEENKSLKKSLNHRTNSISNDVKRDKVVHNLCDSLKLKSGFKQIFQNAKGDNDSETINYNEKISGRNSISSNDNSEQIKGLQDMCQSFQLIINDLEEKVKVLEKSNRNLEIENETLSYKLSESQSQSEQLEHQLLKLDKKHINDSNIDLKHNTVDSNDETLESLQLLLASRLSSAKSDVMLVKQLHDLKSEKLMVENELEKRNRQYEELVVKYDKRKAHHRERILRLRNHFERENKQLNELLESTDGRYKLAEEELLRHRKYSAISEKC